MGNMIDTLRKAFRVPELRKKILFTVFMIVVYRIGAHIPVPAIDRVAFTQMLNRFGQLGSMMDILSGGALATVSIFAMGIQPYINASIIMQLLTVAIPALERLSKEGETGRKKISRITRYFTVGLGLVQSIAFWAATREASVTVLPGVLNAFLVIVSFTAGTAIVMWIGEQINEKGIGNGISLLIFTGIISRIPMMIRQLWQYLRMWSIAQNFFVALLFMVLFLAVSLALFIFVLFIQQAERRIPVQYARRVVGRRQYGGQSTYLPIKVNQSGVLPVIFAMSIATLPNLIVSIFFPNSTGPVVTFFRNLSTNPIYYVMMALLIIGFTFFYSMIQYNPIEISNNLQKNGGFIPGIRPGRPTTDFISRTAHRLCWFDGLFLAIITLFPMIAGAFTKTQAIWFGGTSILIMTGTSIELINQLESQMMMRHYKGFLD